MYNHAPNDYICPICIGLSGEVSDKTLIVPDDIVYRDDTVSAFIGSFFIGKNDGHVIVVPNQHIENLYDMPSDITHHLADTIKMLAIVVRQTYGCEGVTIQQNNEPAGGQHAFHYHVHIYPRYPEDDIYTHMNNKRLTTPTERLPFAEQVRSALAQEAHRG